MTIVIVKIFNAIWQNSISISLFLHRVSPYFKATVGETTRVMKFMPPGVDTVC